jgi:hypothetical protein
MLIERKGMMMGKTKYNVYMESQGVRYLLASFEDSTEAVEFCEAHNWSLTDENGFVWDLDIAEINE